MKKALTGEETKMLMEYMLNNYTEKTYHIGDLAFTLGTVSVEQQMMTQNEIKDFIGTQLQWAQELRIKILSCSLKKFGDKEFKTREEAEKFIKSSNDLIANKITEAQSKFQENLKNLLDRADDFTESPSSSEDSTLSSKEVSSSL